MNKLANQPTNFFHGERFFQNSGVNCVQCSMSLRNMVFSSAVVFLSTDPDAQIITSETAALENAAQAENTQTAHTGIGSWFHQRTNQILAVMIAVILLLILIESLLALKDSMNQERSHRFY